MRLQPARFQPARCWSRVWPSVETRAYPIIMGQGAFAAMLTARISGCISSRKLYSATVAVSDFCDNGAIWMLDVSPESIPKLQRLI